MARPSRWRGPAGWTLRTRLLAALVALLAGVSVVIGLVSVLALNSFLLGRLDTELASAQARSVQADSGHRTPSSGSGSGPNSGPSSGPASSEDDGGYGGSGGHATPPPVFPVGQAEGTVTGHMTGGTLDRAGVLDTAGASHPLSAAQNA